MPDPELLAGPRFAGIDGIGLDHDPDAQIALRVRITHVEPREVRATLTLNQAHSGGPGRAHGGALVTALDEVMGCVAWLEIDRTDCLTATLTTNFRRPAITGRELEIIGRLAERDGRKLWMRGEVHDADGLICEAEGLWIVAARDPAA